MCRYDLFTNTLKDDGFELNPYDACVANKIVNGKQCTIVWYVDDNKISHVEEAVVTKVVKMIEKRFGNLLSAALICRYLVYFELPQLYSIPSPAILQWYFGDLNPSLFFWEFYQQYQQQYQQQILGVAKGSIAANDISSGIAPSIHCRRGALRRSGGSTIVAAFAALFSSSNMFLNNLACRSSVEWNVCLLLAAWR